MNRPDPGSADQGANQDDAVWLDLVARLESDTPPPERNVPNPSAGPARPSSFQDFDPLNLSRPAPVEGRGAGPGPEADGQEAPGTPSGPRDYDVEDDGGDFVPEEPPSLAGTDPLTMLAWLAAVGGPVALLLSAMFWRSAPLLAIVGIVAVFVLGTVYLIMKLPQEKNGDDDGARV
ncbi:hypothetical protein NtRootA9_15760 [Arthrobacter sp. NtRootA9]|jgi:hypothetical protein|nr:hypothetical protein NtRootA9_15760 [Arthrobacter sp. NtRootA9]